MSRTRDGLNVARLTSLLGGRPPPREFAQPLAVAAAGAGGGAGGPLAWSRSIEVSGVALTPGAPYYFDSGWTALTASIGVRRVIGICVAAVADPAASTILLAGEFSRSGTAGASLYASAAGALTETFPGDETDETTAAAWVWPLGWQITTTLAILLPCDPYRPRLLTYCLADGTTQLALTVREYPGDPA